MFLGSGGSGGYDGGKSETKKFAFSIKSNIEKIYMYKYL